MATTPEIGSGMTLVAGSDNYPYTVIAVSASGKRITVQADKARRTDSNGLSEAQVWEIEPNPEGAVYTLSLRKDGYFHTVGHTMEWWNRWGVGRSRYSDPHF